MNAKLYIFFFVLSGIVIEVSADPNSKAMMQEVRREAFDFAKVDMPLSSRVSRNAGLTVAAMMSCPAIKKSFVENGSFSALLGARLVLMQEGSLGIEAEA